MMAEQESPRAALTAEGLAEKPEGSFDAREHGTAAAELQPAQLSSAEREETFRQVLELQHATCEVIIAASRLPADRRGLASALASLAERCLHVVTLIDPSEERSEGVGHVQRALEEYQRDIVLELIGTAPARR